MAVYRHLVSVIIPTYNRSRLVLRALESVKGQIYRPIEIFLIDDGSTDDTEEVVNSWKIQNEESRLSLYYAKKENGGPSPCRNIGIKQAKGEYIYFLDSDDYMYENLFEIGIDKLESERADCVLFGFDTEDQFSGNRGIWLPPDQPPLKSFFENKLWGYTCASIKKTDLIHKVGYWNEEICIGEDYEYLGRVLLSSKKTVVLQKPLLTVSKGSDSLGSRKAAKVGLKHRLIAEKSIVSNTVRQRNIIPFEMIASYSERLVRTAIFMRANGETKFAKEIALLACNLNVKSQSKISIIKRSVLKCGRWACWIWVRMSRLYGKIRTSL